MNIGKRFKHKIHGGKAMDSFDLDSKENLLFDDSLKNTFETGKKIVQQDLSFKGESTYLDGLKSKLNNVGQFDRRTQNKTSQNFQAKIVTLTTARNQINPTTSSGPFGSHTPRQLYRDTGWGQTKRSSGLTQTKGLLIDGVLFRKTESGMWRNSQTGELVRLK